MMDSNTTTGRIIMWMVPRTVSTAITKSMSRVTGIEVWMEPFGFVKMAAGCMRHFRGEELPLDYEGNESAYNIASELLGSMFKSELFTERLSYANVKTALEQTTSKYVFVKDESFAMDEEVRRFLPEGYRHSFLIRHPVLVYSSMHLAVFKMIRDAGKLLDGERDERSFDLRRHTELFPPDILYKSIHSLWKYVRENIDPNPIVIDSSDFLTKPAEMLQKYCEKIGIPFSEKLLDLNVTKEDMTNWVWGGKDLIHDTNFIDVCMSAAKFLPPKKPLPREQLTHDVIELSDAAMPYYSEMYDSTVKL